MTDSRLRLSLWTLKYIFWALIFVDAYRAYRDQKTVMVAFWVFCLLLILNDCARGRIRKGGSRLGFLSLIASIAASVVLKYFIPGIGTMIFIFIPLLEIFYVRGKMMRPLLALHGLAYFAVTVFRGGIPNMEAKLPGLGTNLLSYLGMASILYLFRSVQREKEEVKKLNEELKASNIKLQEYSLKVEELTVAKERTRMAQELHDSLGHSLTALTMNLEFAEKVFDSRPEKVKEIIIKAKDISKNSIGSLRMAVTTLKGEREIKDLSDAIAELVENFSMLGGIKINFNMDKALESLSPDMKHCIYKTVREGLTNGIKHGRATVFDMEARADKGGVRLSIRDNGLGCGEIIESNGLRGIKERIAALGGTVRYDSVKGGGFCIEADIPLYEEEGGND